MDSALRVFSERGYEGSSVNDICHGEGISKGIIYHYFASKDELFLACVEECFQKLIEHIEAYDIIGSLHGKRDIEQEIEQELGRYFEARSEFFESHPVYQRIFCEVMVMPPVHLTAGIDERRRSFDELSLRIMRELLSHVQLRRGISLESSIETFKLMQDLLNIRYRSNMPCKSEKHGKSYFSSREEERRRLLYILLYGVVEKNQLLSLKKCL